MKRNLIYLICILPIFLFGPLYAEGEDLRIGIVNFNPPFVVQGAKNKMFGYDVEMINALCKIMQRTCTFRIYKRDGLIQALQAKEVDIAINTLTITPERLKTVAFSIPYLISEFRFLSQDPKVFAQTFSLGLLQNKKIGVMKGSIFTEPSSPLGVQSAKIIPYDTVGLLLEALQNNKVDFVLMNNRAAIYWDANTPGDIRPVGDPLSFGLGVGVAVDKNNPALLQQINKALLQYQNSPEFKQNYDRYLKQF